MAYFEQAIDTILRHEGGYVNNPNDPGGATNYGISLRFLVDFPEYGDINNDGVVNIEDIRNLTPDHAMTIYRDLWWDRYGYGNINDQTIATKVFDFSVNIGSKRAHTLLQMAINNAFGMNLTADGIIGPATLDVINSCTDGDEEQILLSAYCDEAYKFYQRLIAKNPKLRVFERGWKRRAYELQIANALDQG